MTLHAIARQRLANLRVSRAAQRDPARIVAWLGGMQAQEYAPAKWALGLRLPAGTTDAKIQRALDAGRILRTHVLRPTWHFVTPADVHWMLELSADRVHRAMAPYDHRMGLHAAIFARAARICERVLRDGQFLTRAELAARFADAGLPGDPMRVAHIALYIELEGVITSGPRRGRQSTYALLAERAPRARHLPRDEAIAELARRYFRSHGPATLRDFVWWSGLATPEARRGLEMVRARQLDIEGKKYWSLGAPARTGSRSPLVNLLPIYDEYIIAYRDRDVVPYGPSMVPSRAGGFVKFQHALIVNGQVAGTWRTVANGKGVTVNVVPLRRLTTPERRAVEREVARYQRFLGTPASLSIVT